jgi:hypothetical protein
MDIFGNASKFRKNRDKHIDSSNYQEALKFCNLLIAHYGNNLTFDDWFKAGVCNFKLDNSDEAVHCYNNALTIDPTICQALANKAICLLRLDAINEAFQLLRSALSISSNIGSAWFSIGNYYMERRDQVKGSYEKGINAFRRAVKLIPEATNAKVFIPPLEEYGSVGHLLDFADNIPDLNDQEILDIGATYRSKLEGAKDAYDNADYNIPPQEFNKQSKQDIAEGDRILGDMYYQGQGFPQDYAEAAKRYRKAADQGDAKAQFNLGIMYRAGQGVPQNYTESFKWFRKAADQGDAEAQSNLGFIYNKGQGVPHDYAEAVKWYRKAADQGLAAAQSNLGAIYATGQGVPQDHAEAVKWFRKAADQGLTDAQLNLGSMYYEGEGVPQDHAEAAKWYRKAADQGDPEAQYELGVMYREGHAVPQDYIRAYMWFHLSAAQGNKDAAENRDIVAANMTPEQLAEGQRLSREWKPKKR